MKQLWAPWRLEYIQQADEQEGCVFCRALEADDETGLVVHRGERAFVLLNKYPYASGHLMIAPTATRATSAGSTGTRPPRCTSSLRPLSARSRRRWARRATTSAGTSVASPAPASIDHVHMHVVPRWAGDTNFMPVLADVKVLPEALEETRRKIASAWP